MTICESSHNNPNTNIIIPLNNRASKIGANNDRSLGEEQIKPQLKLDI